MDGIDRKSKPSKSIFSKRLEFKSRFDNVPDFVFKVSSHVVSLVRTSLEKLLQQSCIELELATKLLNETKSNQQDDMLDLIKSMRNRNKCVPRAFSKAYIIRTSYTKNLTCTKKCRYISVTNSTILLYDGTNIFFPLTHCLTQLFV